MLARFALYGFLRNQTYFEAFWILAFREKDLSFFWIGMLFGFKGVCVNLLELPGGALADLYGRRLSLAFSWLGYIISFAVFALAENVEMLFVAMFFYSLGEVFRTGTHKAMIVEWLRLNGRENEKTTVYGFTRSWSGIGSAVSVLVAGAIVYFTGNYNYLFYAAIIPYLAGLINFLGYPKELDGQTSESVSLGEVVRHLRDTLVMSWRRRPLRLLMVEAMTFQGLFKSVEPYLQPALKAAVLTLTGTAILTGKKDIALAASGVYFCIHIISSVASRQSHRFARLFGGEDNSAGILWGMYFLFFSLVTVMFLLGWNWIAAALFLVLHVAQNLWRPMVLTRISEHADASRMTTVLSLESQLNAVFLAGFAPLAGWLADSFGLWAIGAAGAAVTVFIILCRKLIGGRVDGLSG
jgi:MFS family permease